MKFSTREDIAVPIETAFGAVSDFEGFERAALRRGADVVRTDALGPPGAGMSWTTQFTFRNRRRKADLELTDYDPPNGLCVLSVSPGINATIVADLVALSRGRTRMNLSLDLKPTSIPARLLIQSMKLGKATLNRRFRQRVADFAIGLEERHAPKSF